MAPNRLAIYLTSAAALIGGLLPLVANLDWTSTAGILGSVLGLILVLRKWLDGWQMYEARVADAGLDEDDDGIPDELAIDEDDGSDDVSEDVSPPQLGKR